MIYRVRIFDEHHTSLGAEYYSSRIEARVACAELKRARPELLFKTDAQPTPKNKAEMVALLREWAEHPDNG